MNANLQQLDWGGLQLLLAFGETNNLGKAAEILKIDKTTVARKLRALETQLGLQLTIHEGRTLRLTAIGEQVLEAAKQIDETAGKLFRQLAANEPNPTGVVRLTALRALLKHVVLPHVVSLRQRYPDISLVLLGDNRNLAIGNRGADIALRFARPTGTDLVGRKLFNVPYVIAGDRNAPWVTYDESLSYVPEAQWVAANIDPKNIVLQSNGLELVLEAVEAGIGQALLPRYLCAHLPSSDVILTREVWLVMHNETRRSPRIRAVADWVTDISAQFVEKYCR